MPIHKYQDQFRLKKRKQKLFKFSIFAGGIFLVLIGLVYILFFAGFFDIRVVNINGPDDLAKIEITNQVQSWLDTRIWGIRRRANSIMFKTDGLKGLLSSEFLKINGLKISKKSRHELDVNIEERKPVGIWCFIKGTKCFYFDSKGVAYEEVPNSEGFIFTKIIDKKNSQVELGSMVAPNQWLDSIVLASNLLKIGTLNPIKFEIPENSYNEFNAQVSQGWKILFNTSTDIKGQVDSLFEFLKGKNFPNTKINFEYIDLRIQDRIYYK